MPGANAFRNGIVDESCTRRPGGGQFRVEVRMNRTFGQLARADPHRALGVAWELAERMAAADDRRMVLFLDEFQEIANAALQGCPVSQALKGNVNMVVDAALV